MKEDTLILVGDNPFHGVSHVSRERAMQRTPRIADIDFAKELVMTSVRSGANGFTFTVSDTTLAILDKVNGEQAGGIGYYPLVPNVAELVRIAGSDGGVPGLARKLAERVLSRLSARQIGYFVRGAVMNNPAALFKSYLMHEYMRLERVIRRGNGGQLKSILLHEVVTDMALALEMEWLFKAHIEISKELALEPGFETRNLPYLARQFRRWQINPRGIVIEAPFNAVGFQMSPSRQECEEALSYLEEARIVAFSVLAAGYLNLAEAFSYISGLWALSGVAIGVSSEEQATSAFPLAKQSLVRNRLSLSLHFPYQMGT